ncbi:PPC domain-containing protein [Urbifossiella limnaea]|uniref:PPC domain-containing protein n=1 Tax=Urbifossiella limnaea TaxID=2528023 RepID=UPI00192E73C0|nr:PPC domain-containing protein [Urbifossiella limnaea]
MNPAFLRASPPVASYVFPAGGQRGTTVAVRVGGLFLHDRCGFALSGPGVTAPPTLTRTPRIWFEGPVIPLPDSQQAEDYPADVAGRIKLAPDAAVGPRKGYLFTSQGAAGGLVFVVGELPEVVEKEADGEPIPERVTLPVTANGRVFPRDDLDLWEFPLPAGQTVTATAVGKAINSPAALRLDILDAAGRVVAEQLDVAPPGADAAARFTAPAAGVYRVRVADARGQGGPAHVYRLTITTGLSAEPRPADGLKESADAAATHAAPVALTGRIGSPGAAAAWKLTLTKGKRTTFDLVARRAGSPLCGVLTVTDAAGKELAKAEPADATADPTLTFTAPADGTYTVRVAERFRSRGGPAFTYRLKVTPDAAPGVTLKLPVDGNSKLPADALSVPRGGAVKLKVSVGRTGGFTGPVELTAEGLPPGLTAKSVTVPPNQSAGELTIQADATAVVRPARVAISARAGDVKVEPLEVYATAAVPTPFKLVDEYVMTSAPRGEIYRRTYRVQRDAGFAGPVRVSLADRQARHLQGVTGPTVEVPAGRDVFDYPAYLPPWMELGRTCRVCVQATGVVKDADGTEHPVVFSSTGQNQQMIVVVGPGRLGLELGRGSVRGGGEVRLPVTVTRGRDLTGPVVVEAVVPPHWSGATAEKLTIPAGSGAGELVLRFAPGAGPFNQPLTVRATLAAGRTPVVAEAALDVVAP